MSTFADHLQEALGPSYQLDRELTGGGMSRVFVATDKTLGRTVVVKVLPPELAAGVNRERFRREIQLAAQLQHPHIVPLLSAGERGDLLWYTMPFIEGESLRTELEHRGSFPVRDVIRIMHDIVDALAYAHRRGVIHRDIKPANILKQGSHALVTDFGVAKAISAALPVSGVTTAGMAIGTPAYMAPEQLAGDPQADSRLDLYAVGLLAYELLTGASPFANLSPRETMTAQLTRDPKPLDQIDQHVPAALSALIMKCLAKDPNDRPATADAVLEALDAITAPGATPQNGGVPAPHGRHLTRLFAAIGVVTVLLVVATFVSRPYRRNAQAARAAARAHADSIANRRSSTSHGSKGVALTHAESLAIAERVSRRVEAAHLVDSAATVRLRDSLSEVEMVAHADSIMTAYAVEASMTPRRVVIRVGARRGGPPPGSRGSPPGPPPSIPPGALVPGGRGGEWPEGLQLARMVDDSLRHMLASKHEFIVAAADSAPQGRAGRSGPGRGRSVPPPGPPPDEMRVTITLDALPGDSSSLTLELSDPMAVSSYARKNVGGAHVPRSNAMAGLDALLTQAVTALQAMALAPRRTPPP